MNRKRSIATESNVEELIARLSKQFGLREALVQILIDSQNDFFKKSFDEKNFVLLTGVGKFALRNVTDGERKPYERRYIMKPLLTGEVAKILMERISEMDKGKLTTDVSEKDKVV